jgi:NAD(P)-dependent dehydrogenase (short-subunit alcohol dehydrogenase family)
VSAGTGTARGWGIADIPDQTGRSVLVTGANSGIGLRAAEALARRGAHVTLAVRDVGRGEEEARRIRSSDPKASVEVRRLDLADLASVRALAAAHRKDHQGLDVLINNAGVMALPRGLTADGFEMQLGTNHLGHYALTGLLLPSLLSRPEPRVVTVSSVAHRMGKIAFDDLQSERRYRRWAAYGQSKLANVLFAYELQRRADGAGLGLRSVAAHPGYAATNLQVRGPQMAGNAAEERLSRLLNRLVAQSDEQGALPTLYAATVADLPGGSFVGPDGPFGMRGHPKCVTASAAAGDPATAARLWAESEQLTGVRFDFERAGAARVAG